MHKDIFIIGTDGGAKQKPDGSFDSIAAMTIYKINERLYKETVNLKGRTNNYAELYAIFRGVKGIYSYLTSNNIKKSRVVIVTDSELCKKTLTEWFDTWLENAKDEKLYNSAKKLVANQELVKSTIIYLLKLKTVADVDIYHINSHESKENLEKNRRKFNRRNKTRLKINEYEILHDINDYCDKLISDEFSKL